MKLFKILSVGFFATLTLTLVGTGIFVEASTTQATSIADVGVYNATITSQKDNTIGISFNLTNKGNAQAGVGYSVSLIKETSRGQFIVDEYVFPEILSLGKDTATQKTITYNAPTSLSGEYTILLTVKNTSGITLGLGVPGKIKLSSSSKTVEILPETCSLSVMGEKDNHKYTLTQGVDILPSENLLLSCIVLNNATAKVSATPLYETHYRTVYGDIVEQHGGTVDPVSFEPNESKKIVLILPKAITPQAYDVKMSFTEDNDSSNSIIAHYVLHGESATIQNFSLDKNEYKKGETASISLFWSPSADSFSGSRLGGSSNSSLSISATLTDSMNNDCINVINQDLTKQGLIDIKVPIIKNCKNMQATAFIKDSNGNVIDQKILSFKQIGDVNKTKAIFVILGILAVTGIAVYLMKLTKKEDEKSKEEVVNQ